MQIRFAYLVVVDISGYTRFITERSLALEHAEQIITDLITVVIDQSHHPLILNKLEGDAALMYRELAAEDADGARDVLGQVRSFFPAFAARALELSEIRRNCNCAACTNIKALTLKAFVHAGEIAIKQIRHFDELAGEPVIFLHRIMKNTVASREYVLLTDAAAQHAQLDLSLQPTHTETVDGFGEHALWVVAPEMLPSMPTPPPASEPGARTISSTNVYRHLPLTRTGWYQRLWDRVVNRR